MATELKMPALSPTMEKGTLAKWLVKAGDVVKAGDLIAEIETDKATMEFEADEEGVVAQILVPDGSEDVAVGTVLALLAEEGEVAPEPVLEEAVTAIAGPVEEAAPPPAAKVPAVTDIAPASTPFPRAQFADKVKVSPLAARVAHAKGIDLGVITGTGPNGRIVRADLGLPASIAAPAPSAPASFTPAPAIAIAPPPEGVPVETVKLSGMRKTIARRLTESKQQVPHFYLTARCNLDPLLKLRGELNAGLESRGIKLSVNDMLMKALAMALVAVPDANVQFGGDVLHRFSRVDISMAVAIDRGLITPVIKGVDTLSLSAIALQAKELATKARDGKLAPEDYQGGTVSLSNLGMFGIDEMFPVINPPQALILGAAAGIAQPWNVNGEIKLATIMAATASFDHRAIDGAVAAQFMKAFKELVENPITILG
ncbi:pyruvate dehydrogenase complex dihydrolipoamide acetyltransferase [Sphingobium subterraneum]|uniref:Acetyltransferase component of pyruvate dehydrogenase complex n=1 Tax=Sphingobium subterraneum TaxID=627688 RepID=A0A841J325_9SPHN|nr:pyruvate dehydrogenase complex dihydrolipoamide acetyltransferase [Sphingobium subterraneum]MBB6125217.1 pyruvate dehydrogenase E2 component (dihydrolipoamide acetyltransferase) [Sphingobium subterraneum]